VKVIRYALAATTAALLALAPVASAHVTLQPEELPAGGFTRMDVRVPTERDDASTTKVEVQLPPGFLSVSTEPVPGWEAKIVKRKLDKPVEQFGEQISEEVGQISFTAKGEAAGIGPGEFQDFGLSVSVPDKAGSTLTFKTVQTYSSGEVVRWIGPPDSEQPAPKMKLAATEAEGGASEPAAEEQPAAPAESGGDDDSGNTLAIIALVVAIAGLAAGLMALLRSRDRSREMARVR
jgi:periplasmic copper chaperone A